MFKNINKIICFILGHDKIIININHYLDTSYCDENEQGAESTSVTYKCVRCDKIYLKDFYGVGFLNMEDLMSKK